ncbi:MAG: stage II sporulation protein P, partial [Limnochordales bacterium]
RRRCIRDSNGSMHPDWPRNAEFARALADLLERRHPGLFRRIIERPDARLNQDLHPRAVLVEIGSYDTHLEEAVLSAELFAEVVADMLHVLRFGRSVLDPAPVR